MEYIRETIVLLLLWKQLKSKMPILDINSELQWHVIAAICSLEATRDLLYCATSLDTWRFHVFFLQTASMPSLLTLK